MADPRSEFVDLVTHELRSPLTTILGYQELLADGVYGPLDERSAEPVQRIGRAAQYLMRLLDGVIELSEISDASPTLDVEDIDLDELMRGSIEILNTEAADRAVRLDIDLQDPLGRLPSDRERLVRTLDLALTSAVRHPADDRLALRIHRQQDRLELRVENTALPAVDDAESPEENDDDGTLVRVGLRLAIARRTARLLNGRLSLLRAPHGATTLQLTFRPAPSAGQTPV